MFETISNSSKYYYHNIVSFFMLAVWIIISIKGYQTKNKNLIYKISIWIIIACLIQESIDYMNRIFLDSDYVFSIQRDLPLHFCQVSYYFSLLCIFLSLKNSNNDQKYSLNQFLFDGAFLLGFSGALQGILTPDFENINNLIGVICFQLQHSLILLNVIWLMIAYNYRLQLKGVFYTYLLINIIAPCALLINYLLGANSAGNYANYFYVNELPKVDNFFLNFVSEYPSPDYILYIQPIFIIYFISLYLPFMVYNKLKK